MKLNLGQPVDLAGGSLLPRLWCSLWPGLRRSLRASLGGSLGGSLGASLVEDRR